ncbi:hypothetical protein RUR49_19095 [Pseudoxanthobacter sp. M-2]|uniref:hypothetical protein n=1 Tax=Pseudoxanthobacter sp. M-2 TaxID=3078754 RepID=UPI0038FC7497
MGAAAENTIPGGLFGEPPAAARGGASISKGELAKRLGVTAGRVSHFVNRGLPVLPNGRVDLNEALAWYEDNTDPARRKATVQAPIGDGSAPRGATAELNRVRAERETLKLAVDRGQLVDREAVERETFTRARAERDAWIGWIGPASAALAADLGAEPAAAYATLDRLVRAQLANLSDTPIEDLER